MRYLIDTCVLSEWKRKRPCERVVDWLDELIIDDVGVSVLTMGELEKGVGRLPNSKRKRDLADWLGELDDVFSRRIIPVSREIASTWARIEVAAEREGQLIPTIDGLLAATAITHGLTVATRNVSDLAKCGAKVFNPWTDSPPFS